MNSLARSKRTADSGNASFPLLSLSPSLSLFFLRSARSEIERRYFWYGLTTTTTTTNTPCLGPPLHPVSCVSLNEARSTEPSVPPPPSSRSWPFSLSQIRGGGALCSVSSPPPTSHALMDSYSGPGRNEHPVYRGLSFHRDPLRVWRLTFHCR